jgi:hypothetical protein
VSIVLLQQQQNPINAHYVINNARIVMFDTSNDPSRCALLAYMMVWQRISWSVCQ